MDAISLVRQQLGPVVEVLAPLGWATHGRWHESETTRIVRLARSGFSDDTIDELVTELWHTKSKVWLKNVATPLRRYGRTLSHEFQRLQFQRGNLVDQAVACHFAGYYAASTLLTYAQIDGLTRDITGESFFSDSRNDPYIDDTTLAGIQGNLPIVRKFFSQPIEKTDFHGKLSRHGATHGRDLSFGTQTTSTKALVLLGALVEYLEERAEKVARKYQRDHERLVKSLRGADQTGRLLDDRDLDALYFFGADLDGRIFSDLLLGGSAYRSWPNLAHELMRERGLSRRHFSWGGADATSYWWHYKTPAGHYMGRSARRFGQGLPVDWRQWLWDAGEPPSGAPWEEEGWHVYDGNHGPPNWTIETFPVS